MKLRDLMQEVEENENLLDEEVEKDESEDCCPEDDESEDDESEDCCPEDDESDED